jgi:putative hydrolase of the HAD superfamily
VINLTKVRLLAFERTLEEIGRPNPELALQLNRVYRKHRFEDIELYSDVLPTLSALKGNYTMGLLSNGNSYPKHLGLEGMFSFVIFSQDHGIEKPDPGVFQIAVNKAGCTRDQLLHIGDSLNDDIGGAKNAGIKSIWLDRTNTENTPNPRADCVITSLSQLLDILDL